MKNYHLCRLAIAPLRKEASDRSEIVSQLLFGDRVDVLEITEKWCLVKTLHDDYEGWMDYKQLKKRPPNKKEIQCLYLLFIYLLNDSENLKSSI